MKKLEAPIVKRVGEYKKYSGHSYFFVLTPKHGLKLNISDKKRREKKKKQSTWLFLLCNAIIVVGILVYQFCFQETKPLSELFKENPYYRYLTLSLVVMGGFYICESLCYSFLFKRLTGKYKFGLALRTTIIGKYWDSLTPFGSGGQFAQVAYINSKGHKGNTSTSIIVGKYVFFEIAFVILGVVVICLPCKLFQYGVVVRYLALAGVLINLLLCSFIMLVSLNRRACALFVVGGLKLLHKMKIVKNYKKSLYGSLRFIHNYQQSIKLFAKNPLLIIGEILFNVLGLIAQAFISYLIYRTFNPFGTISAIQIMLMAFLCQYATTFIPLPGGSGAAEVSFVAMFSTLFSDGSTFWALLFWRLFTFYLFVIVGFLFTMLEPAFISRRNQRLLKAEKAKSLEQTSQNE